MRYNYLSVKKINKEKSIDVVSAIKYAYRCAISMLYDKREILFPKENNHIRVNARPSSLVDVPLLKCPKTKKVERNSEWRKMRSRSARE